MKSEISFADIPMTRDLVLIGGGHAHAIALRMWGMRPLPGARLTLISPQPVAEYSGMLPGFVAGAYTRDQIEIDLVRLARHAGARLILDRATRIDPQARQVHLTGRGPVEYDLASVDIGVTAEMPDIPGFADHALPVKPTNAFARRWQALQAPGQIVVIGGGIAGLELALSAGRRFPQAQVTVAEAGGVILPEVSEAARRHVLARAARRGVAVLTGAKAVAVHADAVELADGRRLPADVVLGAGGSRVPGWLGDCGLAMQGDRVVIDEHLQTSDPAIFAVGDCAIMPHAPRPPAGVFAVRQGPVLAANLRSALGVGQMRAYRPQRDWLRLIAAGGDAVADKWGRGLAGPWVWRWKDRIDRRFMAMMGDLPAMPAPALPDELAEGVAEAMGDKPLCGGCGAKMGRGALRQVLATQPAAAREDILSGPGDDAGVIRTGGATQVLTTDHLRAFVEDPWLMARIAAVHAMGDIWAMGAQAQSALVQVILPRLSEPLQSRTLTEIMEAAQTVLSPAGAMVIGGHTSTGAELTIGFTLTGLTETPIGQQAQAGDGLILTKPLGTGVVMAAEMLKAAKGSDVASAWDSMARPQGGAAAILARHAHAMTDVTGFGLAGHLIGIAEVSGLSARLNLTALPVLPGAEALSAAGHASTLYPANRAAVLGRVTLPDTPLARLVYDPQTAGGLLAAVPDPQAVLAELHAAGEPGWLIGGLVEGASEIVADQ